LISYEFILELRDLCADDTVTKTALLDVYTYIYGTVVNITPVITQATAAGECTTTATLEFWDQSAIQYFFDNNPPAAAGTPPPHGFISSFSQTSG